MSNTDYKIIHAPQGEYASHTRGHALLAALVVAYACHNALNHRTWFFTGDDLLLITTASCALGLNLLLNTISQLRELGLNRTPLTPALIETVAASSGLLLSRAPGQMILSHAQSMHWVSVILFSALALGLISLTLAITQLVRRTPVVSPLNELFISWSQAHLKEQAMQAQGAESQDEGTESYVPSQGASATASALAPAQGSSSMNNPAERARLDFTKLVGQDDLKARLREVMQSWTDKRENGLILFGEPGTGKTAFAEAVAGELNLPIIRSGFGALNSKWIGEGAEKLQRLMQDAKAQAPCVLFIDEIDALLKQRGSQNVSGEHDKMVNVFLEESVKLRDHPVFLIGATNFIDELDDAAIREGRFDFKVEITLPDTKAREYLVRSVLQERRCGVEPDLLARMVKRWGGFNVKRIQAATSGACDLAITEGNRAAITYDQFLRSLRKIQGRAAKVPEGAKELGQLFYSDEIKQRLSNLAAQMFNIEQLELRGGQLPTGMMLFGEPGTGKSAAAQALAKASGWTFIATTGKELMGTDAIRALKDKASALRPSIVFIDEADDILGDRQHSFNKDATAQLLALMDGAGGNLHDVFWIAATNYPDSIDSAAKRGGRLSMKLGLDKPDAEVMRNLVLSWAAANVQRVPSPAEVWAVEAADLLHGLAQASVFEVLKQAVNDSVMEDFTGSDVPKVELRHVLAARELLQADEA